MTTPYGPNNPGQQPQHPVEPSPQGGYTPQSGNMPPVGLGEPIQRPKDIDTSFLLWISAIVLNVVAVILKVVLTSDATIQNARKQLEAQGQPVDDQAIQNIVNIGRIAGLVFVLIGVALWLLFVFKMRQGKNWARILLTVLAALGAIGSIFSLGSEAPATAVVSILVTLLTIAAIVFMFRPASNSYFDAVKRTS